MDGRWAKNDRRLVIAWTWPDLYGTRIEPGEAGIPIRDMRPLVEFTAEEVRERVSRVCDRLWHQQRDGVRALERVNPDLIRRFHHLRTGDWPMVARTLVDISNSLGVTYRTIPATQTEPASTGWTFAIGQAETLQRVADIMSNPYSPVAPGAVFQYINGERFEGTISEPLGFRGQTASPESLPSDAVGNVITAINGRGEWPAGNVGQGGYTISINERDPKGTALEVYQFTNNSTTKKLGSTMYFGGWEEAWAYAESNGFLVPGMDRELYSGEVASVKALHYNKGTAAMSVWVFDPSVNNWVVAVSFD
jgi:hypothetical protein